MPVGDLDVVEAGHAVDVDEELRCGEPQLHQRDEALAAGQERGLVAPLGEDGEDLVE